jgi:hypothetical protein
MNKKAVVFEFAMIFAAVVIILSVLIILLPKTQISKDLKIGHIQSAQIKTYIEAEKALIYVEQSANLATQQALYDLASQGGINENTDCNTYLGYRSWTSNDKECYPKDPKSSLNKIIPSILNLFLNNHPEINFPNNNYHLIIKENNNLLEISGTATNDLTLPIQGILTTKKFEEQLEESFDDENCPEIQKQAYRNTNDYKNIYGKSEDEVKDQLINLNFQGKLVQVHEKAEKAFNCVIKELKSTNCQYNYQSIGTFNWRPNVNNPERLSLHSFGIAIDINPKQNPNNQGNCITDMPDCLIESFKKYGFQWGCDFSGSFKDAMHFEWRGI